MTEIIKEINRFEDRAIEGQEDYYKFDGYELVTNKRKIIIGVDNSSSCCEVFDAIDSGNLSSHIGESLIEIEVVETDDSGCFEKSSLLNERFGEYGVDCLEAGFIKAKTSLDTIEMAVYNAHNGYYGHVVYVATEGMDA